MNQDSLLNNGLVTILAAVRTVQAQNERFRSLGKAWRARFAISLVLLSTMVTSAVCDESDRNEISLTSLRYCTSEMLRIQATADGRSHQDQATIALCDLYVRLRTDHRYGTSEMLRQDASKIRRRLLTVARRQKAQLKREKVDRPEQLSREVAAVLSARVSKWEGKSDGDQHGAAVSGGTTSGGAASGINAAPPIANGGFAAGGAFDNGWQLIELIQQVVAPDFWKQRGGQGTIQYFALRRVLVVSATTDIHEQIRELLLMLSR